MPSSVIRKLLIAELLLALPIGAFYAGAMVGPPPRAESLTPSVRTPEVVPSPSPARVEAVRSPPAEPHDVPGELAPKEYRPRDDGVTPTAHRRHSKAITPPGHAVSRLTGGKKGATAVGRDHDKERLDRRTPPLGIKDRKRAGSNADHHGRLQLRMSARGKGQGAKT